MTDMLPIPAGRAYLSDARRVHVGPFYLDSRPVSNTQYARFLRVTGRPTPPWMYRPGFGEPEQPVVGVTFDDASAYAKWQGKRLPSEREWVRAARGDDQRTYPWGDAPPDMAFTHFFRGAKGAPAPVEGVVERPAGRGPFGHIDLCGNVWEWCNDGVLKGGFWGSKDVRIDAQINEPLDRVSGGIGFRCAH